jgi:hypothetical protein
VLIRSMVILVKSEGLSYFGGVVYGVSGRARMQVGAKKRWERVRLRGAVSFVCSGLAVHALSMHLQQTLCFLFIGSQVTLQINRPGGLVNLRPRIPKPWSVDQSAR